MKEIQLTRGKVALVDDGDFKWLNQWRWYAKPFKKIFYAYRNEPVTNRNRAMHREILKPETGMLTDHIDGDGLNNQRCNLRVCSFAENARNSRLSSRNKFGLKGVSKQGSKFEARICVNRNKIYLGTFQTAKLASEAYNKAALMYHGEFARLG